MVIVKISNVTAQVIDIDYMKKDTGLIPWQQKRLIRRRDCYQQNNIFCEMGMSGVLPPNWLTEQYAVNKRTATVTGASGWMPNSHYMNIEQKQSPSQDEMQGERQLPTLDAIPPNAQLTTQPKSMNAPIMISYITK